MQIQNTYMKFFFFNLRKTNLMERLTLYVKMTYKISNSKITKSLYYSILLTKQYTPSLKTCYIFSTHVTFLLSLMNIFNL